MTTPSASQKRAECLSRGKLSACPGFEGLHGQAGGSTELAEVERAATVLKLPCSRKRNTHSAAMAAAKRPIKIQRLSNPARPQESVEQAVALRPRAIAKNVCSSEGRSMSEAHRRASPTGPSPRPPPESGPRCRTGRPAVPEIAPREPTRVPRRGSKSGRLKRIRNRPTCSVRQRERIKEEQKPTSQARLNQSQSRGSCSPGRSPGPSPLGPLREHRSARGSGAAIDFARLAVTAIWAAGPPARDGDGE